MAEVNPGSWAQPNGVKARKRNERVIRVFMLSSVHTRRQASASLERDGRSGDAKQKRSSMGGRKTHRLDMPVG